MLVAVIVPTLLAGAHRHYKGDWHYYAPIVGGVLERLFPRFSCVEVPVLHQNSVVQTSANEISETRNRRPRYILPSALAINWASIVVMADRSTPISISLCRPVLGAFVC